MVAALAAIGFVMLAGAPKVAAAQAPAAQPGEKGEANSYRIDTGDRVSVSVYREPDLDLDQVRVRDDGTVRFPLLGDIEVRGLTSNQLEQLLTERLADGYLKKPHVRVSIDAYRLYYITGEVQRPGGYSFLEGLTVEKAVVLAGGFTERAAREDIKLARGGDRKQVTDRTPPDTRIQPGDVITVGESFF